MSEEGGRPRFWRRWGPKGDLILTAAVTVLVGFFLNNQAWTDASVFHDNWRQSPHWIAPEKQNFQEDDPFIRYAEFNTSPFSNLLYKTLAGALAMTSFGGRLSASSSSL